MSDNSNGIISFRNDAGELVPVAPELMSQIPPDRYCLKTGKGAHPLIRVELNIIMAASHPFSNIDEKDALTVLDPMTGVRRDIYDILDMTNLRNKNLLFNYFLGQIGCAAACMASNENGMLYIQWSEATRNVIGQSNIFLGVLNGTSLLAVIPPHHELGKLPTKCRFVNFEHPEVMPIDVQIFGSVEAQQITYIDQRASVLKPIGAQLSRREQSLIDSGARLEEYKGPYPEAVRYRSAVSRKSLT